MTKEEMERDAYVRFVAAALSGLVAKDVKNERHPKSLAREAIEIADTIIAVYQMERAPR